MPAKRELGDVRGGREHFVLQAPDEGSFSRRRAGGRETAIMQVLVLCAIRSTPAPERSMSR